MKEIQGRMTQGPSRPLLRGLGRPSTHDSAARSLAIVTRASLFIRLARSHHAYTQLLRGRQKKKTGALYNIPFAGRAGTDRVAGRQSPAATGFYSLGNEGSRGFFTHGFPAWLWCFVGHDLRSLD